MYLSSGLGHLFRHNHNAHDQLASRHADSRSLIHQFTLPTNIDQLSEQSVCWFGRWCIHKSAPARGPPLVSTALSAPLDVVNARIDAENRDVSARGLVDYVRAGDATDRDIPRRCVDVDYVVTAAREVYLLVLVGGQVQRAPAAASEDMLIDAAAVVYGR